MPAHTHGEGTLSTASAGKHTHSENRHNGSGNLGGITISWSTSDLAMTGLVNSDGAHIHSISGSTGSTGSGSAVTITTQM